MVHLHEDKNEEPIYQGHKHMNYSREKRLSRRSCCLHNANNNRFFERWYGNLFGGSTCFFYKHGVFQSEARICLSFSQIEPQNMLKICLS